MTTFDSSWLQVLAGLLERIHFTASVYLVVVMFGFFGYCLLRKAVLRWEPGLLAIYPLAAELVQYVFQTRSLGFVGSTVLAFVDNAGSWRL